jgi:ABC-type branched-subunit amino acid transport system substrate-binding protein
MYAQAAVKACAAGKGTLSRTSLREAFAKVKLSTSIFDAPISFTADGDLANAKFHIFKIENGKYVTVA